LRDVAGIFGRAEREARVEQPILIFDDELAKRAGCPAVALISSPYWEASRESPVDAASIGVPRGESVRRNSAKMAAKPLSRSKDVKLTSPTDVRPSVNSFVHGISLRPAGWIDAA
jgi:hypothetical protein